MSIDRDDKLEGHDESEYHFSDEEVSYEVEPEASKPAPAADGGSGQKESLVSRLTRSKRMLISLGVFLVLVFVVYKMVSPTSSVPPTDITSAPTVAAQPMPANQPAANTAQPAQVAAMPAAPAAAPAVPAAVPAPATVAQAAPVPAPANQPAAPGPQALQQPGISVAGAQASPGAAVNNAMQMVQPLTQPQAMAQQAQQQAGQQPSATTFAITPGQPNVPVVASLPAVIPVQSAVPTYQNQPVVAPSPLSSMGSYINANSAELTANSQKAMSQLQGQYTQQYNEFTSQNKVLQDQIQSLSSRVAVMESQLNQLVQVLTRRSQSQGQSQGQSQSSSMASTQQTQAPDVKIAYNVQAIIPGRAWLKSDNGETLTVAEGDSIRGVGRVTKIDPYDGVVEINTGNKAISLSYGNGG